MLKVIFCLRKLAGIFRVLSSYRTLNFSASLSLAWSATSWASLGVIWFDFTTWKSRLGASARIRLCKLRVTFTFEFDCSTDRMALIFGSCVNYTTSLKSSLVSCTESPGELRCSVHGVSKPNLWGLSSIIRVSRQLLDRGRALQCKLMLSESSAVCLTSSP